MKPLIIGVDTPETVAPGQPVGCYGREASEATRSLVLGKTVFLEKDVSETDRYGRLLRYVYLEDGRMLNEVLVAEGFAQVSTYPPDVKYQGRFLEAQRQAREAGRGLWGELCDLPDPTPTIAVFAPQGACPQGCSVAPVGCVIKGNISQSSGDRIYHVPGGTNYEATVINPSAGERWFCTAQEADENGWRKPRN